MLDHAEASTPLHLPATTPSTLQGASFGTKFEGLAVSRAIPEQIAGLYPRRQRGHHHVGLAGRDELRRDRGQRRRRILLKAATPALPRRPTA